jgi:hypothetical protein
MLGVGYMALLKKPPYPTSLMTRLYSTLVFVSVGVGTLVNMGIGYMAIANKPKEKKNILAHKAAMFLSLYWILGSAFDEIMIGLVQLTVRDCALAAGGILTVSAFGQTFQLTLIAITI